MTVGVERLMARVVVILGGLFWMAAAFVGPYGYHEVSPMVSAKNALLPLALTLVVLAVGWFFEYIAAALLGVGTLSLLGWGIVAEWEIGVWILMGITLLLPIVISGLLFYMAARTESSTPPETDATPTAIRPTPGVA
jgi:hypothetical protein